MKSTLAALLFSCTYIAHGANTVEPGTLPDHWITGGPNCAEIPDWQVYQYNPDFYIIRESGCTNYEKPFLYLIFGKEKALLEDTGAGEADTAHIVQRVMSFWLAAHHRQSIPLLVCHSHSHGDHVEGDNQLAVLPATKVAGKGVEDVKQFFGIAHWPEEIVPLDLGGRILDVIPIPGHQAAAIALYDRRTGLLLTGDNLYPGRLYVSNLPDFARSTQRLIDFTKNKPVAHILGTHIEQSATPYVDYPIGTKYQPHEHSLELGRGVLLEVAEALAAMRDSSARVNLRDVSIVPNHLRRRCQVQQPTNSRNGPTTCICQSNPPRFRSWPAPSTSTNRFATDIPAIALSSSSGDPNGSFVPLTKRAGRRNSAKCAVRSSSAFPGG
jgi:glyoxylase-like metal-dependent hydrolase (beta-lactamase superfamily II)